MKMIKVKIRLVFLFCFFVVISVLFLLMFFLYFKKSIIGCGVMNLFGMNVIVMLNLIRIIFLMEVIMIFVLYFYIFKKI